MKNYGSLGPHCKNKSSLEHIQIFIAATYYIKFYDEAFHNNYHGMFALCAPSCFCVWRKYDNIMSMGIKVMTQHFVHARDALVPPMKTALVLRLHLRIRASLLP